MERLEILNTDQIQKKTDRITFQIYEDTVGTNELIIAGIDGNGYTFSEKIYDCLKNISDQKIAHVKVCIDKDSPLSHKIDLGLSPEELKGSTVILVDDVINSGRTLIHAASEILKHNVRSLKTAVLVDRKHRRFPIKSDFVGLEVSTTLQNHIAVEFSGMDGIAYLD